MIFATLKALAIPEGIVKKIQSAGKTLWAASEGVEYYGTITPLSETASMLAATTLGNYALFGGGFKYGSGWAVVPLSVINAYDASVTHSTPTALGTGSWGLMATTLGDYALFGGGCDASYMARSDVSAIHTSFTRTNVALSEVKVCHAAATVGNYALFGGGCNRYSGTVTMAKKVVAFNKSLSVQNPVDLSFDACREIAAATVGNYALFGGGTGTSGVTAAVNAYSHALSRTVTTDLSVPRTAIGAVAMGGYALFTGGIGSDGKASDVVDCYNASLTRTNPFALGSPRAYHAVVVLGDFVIIACGQTNAGYPTSVEVYDKSFTRTFPADLSQGRINPAAAAVGSFALIAGGERGTVCYANVDAYTVS